MNAKFSIDKDGKSQTCDMGNGKSVRMIYSPKTQGGDCWGIYFYETEADWDKPKITMVSGKVIQENGSYVIKEIAQKYLDQYTCLKEICNTPFESTEVLFRKFCKIVCP